MCLPPEKDHTQQQLYKARGGGDLEGIKGRGGGEGGDVSKVTP